MTLKRSYVRICLSCVQEVPTGAPCPHCGNDKFNIVVRYKEIKNTKNKLNILREKESQSDLFP